MQQIQKCPKSNLKAFVTGSVAAILATLVISSLTNTSLEKSAKMTTGVGAGVTAALIVGFKKEKEKN